MSATLILHIGMNKTGSTAIQRSLSDASGGDFIYPRLGTAPFKPHYTDALVQLFSSNRQAIGGKKDSLDKPFRSFDGDSDRIAQAAAGGKTVILSSEALFKPFPVGDRTRLKRFADRLFSDVQVVAYVREPLGLISSSFWTKVKASRLSQFRLKYQAYSPFADFDAVFGRENVHLWKYDPGKWPNGNVVEHFGARLRLAPLRLSAPRKNVTRSRPAVSAVYRLNRSFRYGDQVAHKAAGVADRCSSDRLPCHGEKIVLGNLPRN